MVMELEIRPFQETEIQFVSSRKKAGVCWLMGLGKTMCASTVGARARCQRWIIICPTNAFGVWQKDAPRWIKHSWAQADITVIPMKGNPQQNQELWDLPRDPNRNKVTLYVCTPEIFVRDWTRKIRVQTPGKLRATTVLSLIPHKGFHTPDIIVFDEAKRMRNKKSQIFLVLKQFLTYYNPEYFLPMTGTPGYLPKDFWTMLHCIDRKAFSSYWQFVNTFHQVYDNGFGKEIGDPKNTPTWYKLLRRHFSVINETNEVVKAQLPPLQRQQLLIPMDDDQQKLYNTLEREMIYYAEQDDTLIVAPTALALITRLRQALICPRILAPGLGVGAGIKDFADTIEEIPGPYVIFTPFKEALGHFQEYLESRGHHVYQLYGGMSPDKLDETIHLYRSTSGVCLCSLLYAQAFSLEPATRCFFIGYDWDPDNNRQAEARLRRFTSERMVPVMAYYYTMDTSTDLRLYDIVVEKQQRMNITIPADLKQLFRDQKET